MEIIIKSTPLEAVRVATRLMEQSIQKRPRHVLGLATGKTMIPLYQELVRRDINYDQVQTFNLDEYVGLPPDHPASFHHFMETRFFSQIQIRRENVHIPNGIANDILAECDAFEAAIKAAGGLDLQVVGIGGEGHIGFNEPSSSLQSRTRIKTLTQTTRRDQIREFGSIDKVPKHCITMGIGTIMDARSILFFAFGKKKAKIVARAVEGPITAMVPASILQWHSNVKVFLDEAAASRLKKKSYYKWVYRNKPSWQAFE